MTPLLPSFAFLVAPLLLAQGPMAPPAYMRIDKEELKPGHAAAHEATELAWSRALAKAKATDHYLGMASMTGPAEAWFILSYSSYADLEAKRVELEKSPEAAREIGAIALQDGEHLAGTRTILMKYRKELSYGPALEIGKMRYMRVRTYRIKQGQAKAFEEGAKLVHAAMEKVEAPGSFAFYEVVGGMGSPTFVALRPFKALAEMDALEAADKAIGEALGEAGRQAMARGYAENVAGVENQFFAFSPKLSYPHPSMTASDPEFWTVKEEK